MKTPHADYDVILQGGHVIDAANDVDGVRDVAIAGGKIAAVAADLPVERARKVIPVKGCLVTPGLIDIHVHAYGGYSGWLFPDEHALPNGTTTVVDTGSAGWKTFEEFKRTIIERSTARVLAFLNIVGRGMLGPEVENNIEDMEPEPTAECVSRYPELLVGTKTAHFAEPGWVAVDRTVEAGRRCGKPAMIDFWPRPERPYRELVLERLRPGDIHTHVYAAHIPLLDEAGRVQQYMGEARRRGVIFDVGHGAGSFWFRRAVPSIEQGFLPDSISTDMHHAAPGAGDRPSGSGHPDAGRWGGCGGVPGGGGGVRVRRLRSGADAGDAAPAVPDDAAGRRGGLGPERARLHGLARSGRLRAAEYVWGGGAEPAAGPAAGVVGAAARGLKLFISGRRRVRPAAAVPPGSLRRPGECGGGCGTRGWCGRRRRRRAR
jgi:predicted amidohydrolase